MKITLDYPPSANRYWRHNQGRIHRSTEAETYRRVVSLTCITAGLVPLQGDVAVTMHFYRPAKRGDTDNMIKILLDSIQGHAYNNDSQVVELHAFRHDDKDCPRVELTVQPA